jgi:16S rRNA (adenine1518-N6/adenine1519-N6)-dimethyltransferase
MPNRSPTKTLLKESKLAPHKKLGQNFLIDKNIVSHILDKAGPQSMDTIIEIGVGLGALTIPLAQRVKNVIGLEIDAGIVAMHQKNRLLPENVSLVHQDILKCDLNNLYKNAGGNLKIIANLPYSISNPLLFQLIDHHDIMDYAVIMLQKEVGMRLLASPGTKEYGVLTVLLKAVASVEKIMSLGPQYFHPKPKVDSVVVKIIFHSRSYANSNLPEYDPVLLKKIVKTAFQQRRKTLVNSLSSLTEIWGDKTTLKKHIEAVGLTPSIRPDKLTLLEYIKLANQAMPE